MASPSSDPFATLGIAPDASDEAVRAAYRRLAQLHHPDHNGGSPASAVRFAEIQEAYAHVRLERRSATAQASADATGSRNPDLDARIAEMERELRAAREQRKRAAKAAGAAAAKAHAEAKAQAAARAQARAKAKAMAEDATRPAQAGDSPAGSDRRPSDEELGYVTTNDSFASILDDFADQVSRNFSQAHDAARPPGPQRPKSLVNWIDELGSRLTGDRPKPEE